MNRTTAKADIVALNVPSVSNATMNTMLNEKLADNVRFREDVAVSQAASTSNITVDFTNKDRIDLTRTGGALNITISGMGDGEDKSLLIVKTAGQIVTFANATDITPVKTNADALATVLYELKRKGANYFAKAWVETVQMASLAEAQALTITNKAIAPGTIPIGNTTQKGVVDKATLAQAKEFDSGTYDADVHGKVITVETQPKGDVDQPGAVAIAENMSSQDYDELKGGYYIVPLVTQVKAYVDGRTPKIVRAGGQATIAGVATNSNGSVTVTHNLNLTAPYQVLLTEDANGAGHPFPDFSVFVDAKGLNSFSITVRNRQSGAAQDFYFDWIVVK